MILMGNTHQNQNVNQIVINGRVMRVNVRRILMGNTLQNQNAYKSVRCNVNVPMGLQKMNNAHQEKNHVHHVIPDTLNLVVGKKSV